MAMKTVAKFLTTRILVNSLDIYILMDHYQKYPNPNQFCLGGGEQILDHLVLPYSTTIFSIKNPLKAVFPNRSPLGDLGLLRRPFAKIGLLLVSFSAKRSPKFFFDQKKNCNIFQIKYKIEYMHGICNS